MFPSLLLRVMNYINNLRSDVLDELYSIKEDLNRSQKHLAKQKKDYPSVWALPYIKQAYSTIGRLVRYSSQNEATVCLLSQVARWMHVVWLRMKEMSPVIAERAKKLYERVCSLLPSGTTIQLELFDFAEFYNRFFEPVVCVWTKLWLDYWLVCEDGETMSRYEKAKRNVWRLGFKGVESRQLELDLVY